MRRTGVQHFSSEEEATPAATGPRYNFRKRSQMKAPARYASLPALASGHSPGLFEAATPTHNLTDHLKPCATFRQPDSEVHIDEIAEYSLGNSIDNAVFSHAWAPDGRGVFVCGGPLAMGVRGCYMSMWS